MIRPAFSSTWPRSRCSPPSTTSTSRPRTLSARATCRPRRPPPTTTARSAPVRRSRPSRPRASSRRQSVQAAEGVHLLVQPAVDLAPARGSAAASGSRRWRGPARRTAPGCGRRARPRAPRGGSRRPGCRAAARRLVAHPERERRGVVGPLQDGREQDPVVRRVRLVADQRDPTAPRPPPRRPAAPPPSPRPPRRSSCGGLDPAPLVEVRRTKS